MPIYKCVKKLFVDEYDEDGSWTENQIEIKEGSTWRVDEESPYNEVAGADAIRLVNDKGAWMELYPDTIDRHFIVEDRSAWVTKEQLDTPLCEIFEGTRTKGTAREYVLMCEAILGWKPTVLESLEYEEMNKYIDSLAHCMESLQ